MHLWSRSTARTSANRRRRRWRETSAAPAATSPTSSRSARACRRLPSTAGLTGVAAKRGTRSATPLLLSTQPPPAWQLRPSTTHATKKVLPSNSDPACALLRCTLTTAPRRQATTQLSLPWTPEVGRHHQFCRRRRRRLESHDQQRRATTTRLVGTPTSAPRQWGYVQWQRK